MFQSFLLRVKSQLRIEKARYSHHSLLRLACLSVFLLMFFIWPSLLRLLLPILTAQIGLNNTFVLLMLTMYFSIGGWYFFWMHLIYKNKIRWLQQFRVNPQKLWPWEEDPEAWRAKRMKSIGWSTINAVIYILSIAGMVALGIRYKMEIEAIPTASTLLKQFFILVYIQDFFFYFIHRVFHESSMYKYHKVHHQYSTSIVLTTFHTHPVEYVLANILPTALSLEALQMCSPVHLTIVMIFMAYRLHDAYNGHCGYSWPWAFVQLFPFCTNDGFHDWHHSQNDGNYGSTFRFWDMLLGTNKSYKQHVLRQIQNNETGFQEQAKIK